MTQEQANEVVTLMRAASASRIEQDTLDYFGVRLLSLDYELALTAATTGAAVWRRFPSWAEFNEHYQMKRRAQEASEVKPFVPPDQRGKIPFWVKRWIAARLLYSRFGKEKDTRPFTEQRAQIDPFDLEDIEWMPETEWVEEAKQVDDRSAWVAIQGTF